MPSTSNSSLNDETLIKPWNNSDLRVFELLEKTWSIVVQFSESLLIQLNNYLDKNLSEMSQIIERMKDVDALLKMPVVKLSDPSAVDEPTVAVPLGRFEVVLRLLSDAIELMLEKVNDIAENISPMEELARKINTLYFLLTCHSLVTIDKSQISEASISTISFQTLPVVSSPTSY